MKEGWEVEEQAPFVVVGMMHTEQMEPLKRWAFENGEQYANVLAVMSIDLRNKVMEYYNIPMPKQQKATKKQ